MNSIQDITLKHYRKVQREVRGERRQRLVLNHNTVKCYSKDNTNPNIDHILFESVPFSDIGHLYIIAKHRLETYVKLFGFNIQDKDSLRCGLDSLYFITYGGNQFVVECLIIKDINRFIRMDDECGVFLVW